MSNALMATETTSEELVARYRKVRAFTEELCRPLAIEDYVVQSMPDVSPTKWHICHVSWFFEQFVLGAHDADYESPDPRFAYLFNSYYVQAGPRFLRPRRGLLSRPTVEEAFAYRARVDRHMGDFITGVGDDVFEEYAPVIEVGLNHEQQHQELMLTDIKHVLAQNPLNPVYRALKPAASTTVPALDWVDFEEGVYEIGHDGEGFAYDNEDPRHRTFLEPYQLTNRLITNGEYLEFMADGGYRRSELWLSEGWATVQEKGWEAPMYWQTADGAWAVFTLGGCGRWRALSRHVTSAISRPTHTRAGRALDCLPRPSGRSPLRRWTSKATSSTMGTTTRWRCRKGRAAAYGRCTATSGSGR